MNHYEESMSSSINANSSFELITICMTHASKDGRYAFGKKVWDNAQPVVQSFLSKWKSLPDQEQKKWNQCMELCLLNASLVCYYAKDLFGSFDFGRVMLDLLPNLNSPMRSRLLNNQQFTIPAMIQRYVTEPKEKVKQYTEFFSKENKEGDTTVLFVNLKKNFNSLEKCINSFIHTCSDWKRIKHFLCFDFRENKKLEKDIQVKFPFITFIFCDATKTVKMNDSVWMNQLFSPKQEISPYVVRLEDSNRFIYKGNWLSDAISVVEEDKSYGQCMLNRNYIRTPDKVCIEGGLFKITKESKIPYVEHVYHPLFSNEYIAYIKQNAHSNAHIPNFSFDPSVMKLKAMKNCGIPKDKKSDFEHSCGISFTSKGYKTAFLDSVSFINSNEDV